MEYRLGSGDRWPLFADSIEEWEDDAKFDWSELEVSNLLPTPHNKSKSTDMFVRLIICSSSPSTQQPTTNSSPSAPTESGPAPSPPSTKTPSNPSHPTTLPAQKQNLAPSQIQTQNSQKILKIQTIPVHQPARHPHQPTKPSTSNGKPKSQPPSQPPSPRMAEKAAGPRNSRSAARNRLLSAQHLHPQFPQVPRRANCSIDFRIYPPALPHALSIHAKPPRMTPRGSRLANTTWSGCFARPGCTATSGYGRSG